MHSGWKGLHYGLHCLKQLLDYSVTSRPETSGHVQSLRSPSASLYRAFNNIISANQCACYMSD